ncbi:MAG: hypothetical protein JST83_12370 [Bacteroidetes bacterium]|nr:hypothetical protein [Bacteroidota bacterium]
MRKLLSLVIIVLACAASYAQVPGYMGLKCSLQYQGGISPQWNDLHSTYRPYLYHNVQADYVVTRRHAVGLQYTRLDFSSNVNRYINDFSTANEIYVPYRQLTVNSIGAYVKFFRAKKGFIAPLGRYIIMGLNYQMTTDRLRTQMNDSWSGDSYQRNMKVVSHDVTFRFGMGRNIILANRLLITIEGDINVPLSSGIRAAMSGSTFSVSKVSDAPYKHFNSIDAMLANLVQIKIGIGALLF